MQIYDRLIVGLFVTAGVLLTLMVLAILWDAIFRSSGLEAPIWLSTFTEYSLALLTMLVAPYLVRIRRHVTMDLFDNAVSARTLKRWTVLTDLTCAGLCLVLAYYAFSAGYTSFVRGEIDVQAIDLPRWLVFAFLTPGFLLCAFEFIRHVTWASAEPLADVHPTEQGGV